MQHGGASLTLCTHASPCHGGTHEDAAAAGAKCWCVALARGAKAGSERCGRDARPSRAPRHPVRQVLALPLRMPLAQDCRRSRAALARTLSLARDSDCSCGTGAVDGGHTGLVRAPLNIQACRRSAVTRCALMPHPRPLEAAGGTPDALPARSPCAQLCRCTSQCCGACSAGWISRCPAWRGRRCDG
jgi:hypothetical protein